MIKSNSSTVLLMALGVMSFLVPETNDVALEVRKKYIPQFLPLTLKKEGQKKVKKDLHECLRLRI